MTNSAPPAGSAPLELPAWFAPVTGLLSGATSLTLGILVLAWPGATLTVVAVLFGIHLVVTGAMRVAVGAFSGDVESWIRAIYVVTGVIVILAGVTCLRHPVLSVAIILVLIATGWLVDGIMLIVAGANSETGRLPLIALGALTLIAALVLVSSPVSSTVSLLHLGGWLLVVIGVVGIVTTVADLRRTRPTATS